MSRPAPPGCPGFARSQNRFDRTRVNACGFPGSERLPSTECSRGMRPFGCMPIGGNPPPISRFCHRRFGFRRCFASPSSRAEGLDPTSFSASSSLVGATGHTPPVNFCNRSDPRAQPRLVRTPRNHTSGRPAMQLVTRTPCFDSDRDRGWLCALRRAANRGFTGQGPSEAGRPRYRHLSSRSLARVALPQPDRLGHLSLPTRDGHRPEKPAAPGPLSRSL